MKNPDPKFYCVCGYCYAVFMRPKEAYMVPGADLSAYYCTRCGKYELRDPRPYRFSYKPILGSVIGALLGGLLCGPPGALVGGLIGFLVGEERP